MTTNEQTKKEENKINENTFSNIQTYTIIHLLWLRRMNTGIWRMRRWIAEKKIYAVKVFSIKSFWNQTQFWQFLTREKLIFETAKNNKGKWWVVHGCFPDWCIFVYTQVCFATTWCYKLKNENRSWQNRSCAKNMTLPRIATTPFPYNQFQIRNKNNKK